MEDESTRETLPGKDTNGEEVSAELEQRKASDVFFERLPKLLVALGAILIAFYFADLVFAAMNELEIRTASHAPAGLRSTLEHQQFWRTVYNLVFNEAYLYLIVGIVLILIGVHLINNPRWNRLILPAIILCAINLLLVALGFIVVLFVLDWSMPEGIVLHLNRVTGTILGLIEIGALGAIILIETPDTRRRIAGRLKALAGWWRGDEVDEEVGETKEGIVDSTS